MQDEARLRTMGKAARDYALTCQWDTIFEDVYAGYPHAEQSAEGEAL